MLRNTIKLLSIITLSCFLLLCSGCNAFSEMITKIEHDKSLEDKTFECINNSDVDGLYSMFSEAAKEDDSLMHQLSLLCYYWNSLDLDISNHDVLRDAGSEKEFNDGKLVYCVQSHRIDIVNRHGTEFSLEVYEFSVDPDHPERIGVNAISIWSINTKIYGTVSSENNSTIKKCEERMDNVIDSILELQKNTSYSTMDDSERVQKMISLLNEIIDKDMSQYGEPIIDPQSIEETTSNDGFGRHPAVKFNFFDGSQFVIIVHNNP